MCPKLEVKFGMATLLPRNMPMCPCRSPSCRGECVKFLDTVPLTSTPRKPHYKKKSRKAKKDSPSSPVSYPIRKTPSPVANPNKKTPNRRRRRQSSSSSSVTGCSFSSNDSANGCSFSSNHSATGCLFSSNDDSAYGTDPHSSGTESPSKGGSPYRMSPVECQTPPSRTGFSKLDFADLTPMKFDDIYGIIDDDNRHAGCKYHTLPDPENLPKPPTEWLRSKEDIKEDINATMSQELKLMLKVSH